MQQAIDRAGKKYDKGKDLANACMQMLDIQNKLRGAENKEALYGILTQPDLI